VKVALLLLAAGRGTRFGGEVPKAFLSLGGKTLLLRSAERLRQLCPMDQGELIVLVSAQDRATHLRPLTEPLAALGAHFVDGGDTRQQSMQNGLAAASKDCELVLIHDAARPLFPIAAARECLRRAAEVGAALLAIPSPDTLKRVNAHGLVEATIDRTGVFCAQTPQVLRRDILVEALDHARAVNFEATDDVSLAEAIGCRVAVVTGSPQNLKITQKADLAIAEALLRNFDPYS
jgi:2-C-methyl-D-erythritol 4-phosphate cytidylyltransferase